jgi:hypothetical protein
VRFVLVSREHGGLENDTRWWRSDGRIQAWTWRRKGGSRAGSGGQTTVAMLGNGGRNEATVQIMVSTALRISVPLVYIHSCLLLSSQQLLSMASARPLPLGFRLVCLDPATLLEAWCAGRHASFSQTRCILALLDSQHLLALPLLPRIVWSKGIPG